MRQLLSFTTLALLVSLAATPAQAESITLDYQGLTFTNSSLNGTSIAPGTSFEVQATFDPTMGTEILPGAYSYQAISMTAIVNGTSYSVTDPSDFGVGLFDATNPAVPGDYLAGFDGGLSGSAFSPI